MRGYRLNRSIYASYDGEGSRLSGGRWNSRGTRVVYLSENRALCILEVLVHLASTLPDNFVLGQAEIHATLSVETVEEATLPPDWNTLSIANQLSTRLIGDEWAAKRRSAILRVPSVVADESNHLLNPDHSDFQRIYFFTPQPFHFDPRLFGVQSGKAPLAFKIN